MHHFIQFNYESNCWCCRRFPVTSEISNQYLLFISFSAWVRLTLTHALTHKHALIQLPVWCPCSAPYQTLALLTNVEETRHWSHNWMIIQLMYMKKYEGDLKWAQQILTPRLGCAIRPARYDVMMQPPACVHASLGSALLCIFTSSVMVLMSQQKHLQKSLADCPSTCPLCFLLSLYHSLTHTQLPSKPFQPPQPPPTQTKMSFTLARYLLSITWMSRELHRSMKLPSLAFSGPWHFAASLKAVKPDKCMSSWSAHELHCCSAFSVHAPVK